MPKIKPLYIVVHHSATNNGNARSFEKYHKETNGWSKLGYNYVIPREGSIENIIGELEVGIHAGVSNYNEKSIGICVVADYENGPTRWQYRQLVYLIHSLMSKYGIPIKNVLGHKELGRDTKCPGLINMDSVRLTLQGTRELFKAFMIGVDLEVSLRKQ